MDRLLAIASLILITYFLLRLFTSFFRRNYNDSKLFFMNFILSLCIGFKLNYTCYNIALHALAIIVALIYYTKRPLFKISSITASTNIILIANILLFFTPDNTIYKYWSGDEISWRTLTWNDFKGNPESADSTESTYSALTSAGVEWKVNRFYNYPPAVVRSYMNTNASWKTPSVRVNDDSILLQHEQVHFNIYEISARAINNELYNHWAEPKDSLNHLIRTMAKNATFIGAQYDIQTEHGLNQKIQNLWNSKIKQALNK